MSARAASARPANARVIAPGLQATVQDGGRHGFRHLGVGSAGALDGYSHAVANLLVGNPAGAAVIESTLVGPTLRFDGAVRVALCGAASDAHADGVPVPGWRPVDLPAGSELRIGRCRDGARSYLAVAGGWRVAMVLGSASTDLRGGFGGVGGRALVQGDVLDVGPGLALLAGRVRAAPWWIDPGPDLDFSGELEVRVLPGHETTRPADAIASTRWRVAAASNRQGLRLEGAALSLDGPGALASQRLSEPVAPGAIQLPADGQPIVLLADAQSHGGYPRIGHVARCDLPRLAQARPGHALRFVPCTRAHAERLRREQVARLHRIALAIAGRQWA